MGEAKFGFHDPKGIEALLAGEMTARYAIEDTMRRGLDTTPPDTLGELAQERVMIPQAIKHLTRQALGNVENEVA